MITANGVGSAVITTKLTYGTKTISKNITVKVTEAVDDGISVSLQNAFSSDYPDAVVTNWDLNKERCALIRAYYGKNGKGVNNEYLTLKYTVDNGYYVSLTPEKTDLNGVAYFKIPCNSGTVAKVSYTIAPESDKTLAKDGSFSFAYISSQAVENVNGIDGKTNKLIDNIYDSTDYKAAGFDGLKPSENDKKAGSANPNALTSSNGTYSTLTADTTDIEDPAYTTEYVNSQQVSDAAKDNHKVGFVGGLPFIELPGESSINSAVTFQQDVNITSGEYHTYADDSKYITLNVDPNELTYATLNFTNLTLSKYTKLEIEAYKSEADAKEGKDAIPDSKTSVLGPTTQNTFSYQIPLTNTKANSLCVRVKLISKGQVNTETNKGYTIKDITGVYKNKKSSNGIKEVLKGAKIEWKAVTAKYSEEIPFVATGFNLANGVQVTKGDVDAATNKTVEKVTYRVPVYPYTGNAIITTYDKNGSVIAYFACPTWNEDLNWVQNATTGAWHFTNSLSDLNKNTLKKTSKYIYRISEEEAFNNVGTVTQSGNLVTVNSDKAGVTNLEGTVTGVEGLDATNSKVYTSVQWNPVTNSVDGNSCAIAFAGQEVTLTAQLVDKNNNAVASANQHIDFYHTAYAGDAEKINKGASTLTVWGETSADKKVSVLDCEDSTDSKGQAKLIVSAVDAKTVLESIEAKATNSSYNVVLKVNGDLVKKLDLYWIEATPGFTDSATDDHGCKPNVGENWEYGFYVNGDKLAAKGEWSNKYVNVNNAKIAVAAETGSKGTTKTDTGVNGMAVVTSNQVGDTKLSAVVDGTAYDKNPITFDVYNDAARTDAKAKGVKNVGEGTTSFANKYTDAVSGNKYLTITWQTVGATGSFVDAMGFKAVSGSAITLYFKASDKLGNALYDTPMTFTNGIPTVSTVSASAIVGGVQQYVLKSTNTTGIVPITVAYEPGVAKKMVTVNLNGVPYKQTVEWTNEATVALDNTTINGATSATSADTFKTYADGNKIVLTFTKDILASSVIADEFSVKRGGNSYSDSAAELQAIDSVKVSGKQIIITFKNPITDNVVKPFWVKIDTKKVNDVDYYVTTTDGQQFKAANINVNDNLNQSSGTLIAHTNP